MQKSAELAPRTTVALVVITRGESNVSGGGGVGEFPTVESPCRQKA